LEIALAEHMPGVSRLGTIAATKACYRASTQGHDEECGLSGKTGIHYSQGVLTVTHPANKSDAAK
jgi:hypothetical protein